MNVFSIDVTLGEIQLLRQSLDVITISGKDARVVAALQTKLETEIQSIEHQLRQAELNKQQELLKAVQADKKNK